MVWKLGDELKNGKYIINGVLGTGRFGSTYLAKHKDSDKLLVIKTLSDELISSISSTDRDNLEIKFWQEAAKLAKSQHPNIVKAGVPFKEAQSPCIAMEYIDGRNLAERAEKIYDEEVALKYIQQIGEALITVHENGLIHRDVKPGNILLRPRKGITEAVLIDFGLALEFDLELITVRTKEASEGFAPPELYSRYGGKIGPHTDVYSLAATLYYAVTGKYPASSEDVEILGDKTTPPIEFKKTITDKLNKAILRGLSQHAKDRPASIKIWLDLVPTSSDYTLLKKAGSIFKRKLPYVELISLCGIDYIPLEKMLFEQKWKKADQETAAIILKILDRETESWLRLEDIAKIPCEDLHTIDKLWMYYTNERFGFSIQKQIWKKVGGDIDANDKTWERFGKHVGWYVNFFGWTSNPISKLKFRFQKGYFPTIVRPAKGVLIGKGAKALLDDLREDLISERQKLAKAIANYKRQELQYYKLRREAKEWQTRAQMAMGKGDEDQAKEALKTHQHLTEKANLSESNLVKRDEELEYKKRKHINGKEYKLDYVQSEILDLEISCLSSKLEQCNISWKEL